MMGGFLLQMLWVRNISKVIWMFILYCELRQLMILFSLVEDGPVEDTVQLYILSLDSSDDSTVTSHTTATLPPICE